MPWSQWQPREVHLLTPGRLTLQWTTSTTFDYGEAGTFSAPHTSPFIDSAESLASARVYESTFIQGQNVQGFHYWKPDGWDTFRDYWSPVLDGLAYGVDYGPRPDRDEATDVDVYVEYAEGPNDFQGWATGTFDILANTGIDEPAVGGVVEWGYGVDVSFPRQPYQLISPLQGPPVTLAARSKGANLGTYPGPSFGSAVDSFAFWGILSEPTGSGSLHFRARLAEVRAEVLKPAWRYWIPETSRPIPLRQRQRDDGLGLSPTRWRMGRSSQASNRWVGYL